MNACDVQISGVGRVMRSGPAMRSFSQAFVQLPLPFAPETDEMDGDTPVTIPAAEGEGGSCVALAKGSRHAYE